MHIGIILYGINELYNSIECSICIHNMANKGLHDWLLNALFMKTGQCNNSAQPFVGCRILIVLCAVACFLQCHINKYTTLCVWLQRRLCGTCSTH